MREIISVYIKLYPWIVLISIILPAIVVGIIWAIKDVGEIDFELIPKFLFIIIQFLFFSSLMYIELKGIKDAPYRIVDVLDDLLVGALWVAVQILVAKRFESVLFESRVNTITYFITASGIDCLED